eukprot:TRINITY_DN43488_c0_g1_i1.p1 TRINITY_DN43488_c0_g1~~TRINITY_DN43488_c0_g1_i1.p1  ORF type:complete len:567 (+),score=102.08 TRINITY_DN43488_c0_g1_i1:62-1702(+)
MGASQGRRKDGDDYSDEEPFQDDVFPWFHLVQWCAEDAAANRIFRWDLKAVQAAATALTEDIDAFLSKCPHRLPKDSGFTMDDDTNFAEWAGALLEWNPELRKVRFRLVPQRMKEEVFWSRYFAGLRTAVRRLMFDDADSSQEEEHCEASQISEAPPVTHAKPPPSGPEPEKAGKLVSSTLEWLRDGISLEEVQKHKDRGSAWIIVKDRVYDATGFLEEHPGGSSTILRTAGGDATEDFEAMHPDSARALLEDHYIGALRKVEKGVTSSAPAASLAQHLELNSEPTVLGSGIHQLKLLEKIQVSHDTRIFRFALPFPEVKLGLPIGMHLLVTVPVDGAQVTRPYTPITDDTTLGHVDLLVKVYFANTHPKFPDGGLASQYLESLRIGGSIDIKGPRGEFAYKGRGIFSYRGRKRSCTCMSFIAGGTGITPCFQVISAVLRDPGDNTHLRLLFANQTPSDILLREQLENLAGTYPDRLTIWFTVDHVADGERWDFDTGFITEEMLQKRIAPPGDGTLVLTCGPPAMVDTCMASLQKLGHADDSLITF